MITLPDTRSASQKQSDYEESARDWQNYLNRMARMKDYAPIEERDSPCLNGCVEYGIYGCRRYKGGIVENVKQCEKYRNWMVSRFPDGEIGLKRYIEKIKENI